MSCTRYSMCHSLMCHFYSWLSVFSVAVGIYYKAVVAAWNFLFIYGVIRFHDWCETIGSSLTLWFNEFHIASSAGLCLFVSFTLQYTAFTQNHYTTLHMNWNQCPKGGRYTRYPPPPKNKHFCHTQHRMTFMFTAILKLIKQLPCLLHDVFSHSITTTHWDTGYHSRIQPATHSSSVLNH